MFFYKVDVLYLRSEIHDRPKKPKGSKIEGSFFCMCSFCISTKFDDFVFYVSSFIPTYIPFTVFKIKEVRKSMNNQVNNTDSSEPLVCIMIYRVADKTNFLSDIGSCK